MRIRAIARFAAVSWPLATIGCGADVDVGGTYDASASPDANVDAGTGVQCEPCANANECAPGLTCGQFAGDMFCALLCANHSGCASDETCSSITTSSGSHVYACTPTSGTCNVAAGPTSPEGGVLTKCGSLVGPTVSTTECHSCGTYSNDCQANGCYGGWWCNTSERWCEKPPTSCP